MSPEPQSPESRGPILRGVVAVQRIAEEHPFKLRIGLEWYRVEAKVDEPDPASRGVLTIADVTIDVLALTGAPKYAPLPGARLPAAYHLHAGGGTRR